MHNKDDGKVGAEAGKRETQGEVLREQRGYSWKELAGTLTRSRERPVSRLQLVWGGSTFGGLQLWHLWGTPGMMRIALQFSRLMDLRQDAKTK